MQHAPSFGLLMVICAEGIPRILIPEPSPIVPNIPLSDSLMRVVFPSLRLHRRRGLWAGAVARDDYALRLMESGVWSLGGGWASSISYQFSIPSLPSFHILPPRLLLIRQ